MKRVRVDLHIHTQASDGTWTAQQVVEAAVATGIDLMAVTDHDSVGSVLAAERVAKEMGMGFVRGVEISTTEGERSYHVLGYGVDVANKLLQEVCRHNEALLDAKDELTVINLAEAGWPVSIADYRTYKHDKSQGAWPGYGYLRQKGLVSSVADFFARAYTPEHGLTFPVFISISEAIATIHAAGGLAFLAHPASSFHGPGLKETLRSLEQYAFDGIECYHSGHTGEDSEALCVYARERGKLISGGSDCHGTFIPTRPLGKPEIYLENINLGGLYHEQK